MKQIVGEGSGRHLVEAVRDTDHQPLIRSCWNTVHIALNVSVPCVLFVILCLMLTYLVPEPPARWCWSRWWELAVLA